MANPAASPAPSASTLAGRVYFIIFWEPTATSGDRAKVHAEHIASVKQLEKDGLLLQAGPFLGDDGKPNGYGMFVLRVDSAEKARAIAEADAYYRGGYRTFRLQPWRRSEGSVTIRLNIADGSATLD